MNESMEPGDLPEVRVAILGRDELCTLLRDLKDCAHVSHVSIKRSGKRMADEAARSLEEAGALLLGRDVQGVQIQYRFEGREYCDTIMCVDDGFRVVRM